MNLLLCTATVLDNAARVRQCGSAHYTKIGNAGFRRHVGSAHSASPAWTLDQPGTAKSLAVSRFARVSGLRV